MHCKHDGRRIVANHCNGIGDCFCDCEDCLIADEVAGLRGDYDDIADPRPATE